MMRREIVGKKRKGLKYGKMECWSDVRSTFEVKWFLPNIPTFQYSNPPWFYDSSMTPGGTVQEEC